MKKYTNIKKKDTNDILFSILNDITATRSVPELLKIIFSKLKNIIDFDDVGLFHVLEDGRHRDLTAASQLTFGANKKISQYLGRDWLPSEPSFKATLKKLLVQDFDDFFDQYPEHPHYQFLKDEGLKQFISTPLIKDKKVFGLFILWSKTENTYTKKDIPLFSQVTAMIAIALSNILDREELLEEKNFKETLLTITSKLSTVSTGQFLIRTILDDIKDIFNFYDIGLFVFAENRMYLEDWAVKYEVLTLSEGSIKMSQSEKVNTRLQVATGSNLEWELDMLTKVKGPTIIDLTQMAEDFPAYEQSEIIKSTGYRDSMQTLLKYGGETLGFFCINALEKGFFNKSQYPIFQAIADQLAIAVSNIISNEALLKEKNFKETLLGISETVSTTHNRGELLNIIFNKLKPIFNFCDTGLFVLSEDGQKVTDWSVLDETVDPSKSNTALLKNEYATMLYPGSALEWAVQDISKNDTAVIYDYEVLKNRFSQWPHFSILLEHGIKECISVVLRNGGKIIGMLNFNALEVGHFKTHHLPLFEAIADQLSVAVSNILAQEQLLEEKNFKETLLAISEAVASIQDRKELFKVIFERINPIIPIDDVGVVILDESGNKWKDWAVLDNYHDSNTNTALANQGLDVFHKHDKLTALAVKETGILTTAELKKKYNENPFIEVMESDGLKEFLFTPLKVGNKTIGAIFFDSRKEGVYHSGQFPLFKAIADQLAVAVSNVLANEKLLKEKYFKETLLSISEAVSEVQNRKQLLKIIFEKIKSIIDFDHAGLFIIDHEKDVFYEILEEGTLDELQDNLADSGSLGPFPYSGNHPDALMYIDKVSILDLKEHSEIYTNVQLQPILEYGLKKIIVAPLQHNNQRIGFLCFLAKDENQFSKDVFPLVKAISNQVTIAVNNVLANEKLITEKEFSTTLLHITEAVAQVKDAKDLYRTIFKHIKPVFPYDELGLFVVDKSDDSHYELITSSDLDEGVAQKLIEKNLGANQKFKHSGTSVEWLMEKGPLAMDLEEMDKIVPHPQHQFMLEGGLKNIIGGPLSIGGKPFGMVCFNSTISNFYNEEHLILFKSIAEQISVAVSNILSRQQLIEREQEKTTLLDITSAVSKIRNLRDFLSFVMTKLQPIFKFYDVGVFLVTNDGQHHFDVASTPTKIEEASSLNYFSNVDDTLIPHKDSAIQWAIEKIESENKPVLFDFKDLAKQFPDYYQFEAYDFVGEGYRDSLAANLKVGDDILGMFCINALEKDFFKKEQFSLFQNVTEQLSVAVSNILANNNIVEREQEKATLLEITSAVSKIRNLPDFLSFVTKKLKPIFNFVDVGIFLLTDDGKYHYDMAGHDEEVSKSPINDAMIVDGNKSIVHKGSLIEWMMNQIKKEEGPILFDFVQLVNDFPDYYQFTLVDILESGYRDCLAAKLKFGDTVFGMFCINALEKDFFKKEQFSLFQNVTEQLSVAVSNILANEELLEEKKLKETLLEVSEAINTIRNKKELYDTIMTILQPHLGFADAVLCIVDEELGTHIHPLTAAPETTIEHPLYKAVVENHLHTKGSPMEAILLGDDVNEMLLVDWLERFPTYPGFLLMKDVGLQYSFTLKLKNQNKNIGIWFFHFTEPQILDDFKIKLYTNLRNQISIALTNILAQESVEKEQEYSETLLEITEALAVAEDAVQLHNAIHTVVRKLIPFDKVEVLVLDKSGEYHYELINEAYVNSVAGSNHIHTDFARQTLYELAGTPVDWFTNNGPDIVTMDFLAKHTFCVLHNEQRKEGIKEVIGGPLKNQGEIIGMLAFKLKEEGVFNQQHVKHYKSVAEQVSICLANILSKKEILWKSAVQKLEIKLSNILTEDHTTIDKWGSIFQEFKKCIPFSLAMVLKVEEGKIKRYVYEFITPKEKRQLTMEDVMEISKLSEKEFIEAERALYKASSKKSNFFDKSTDLPIPASKLLDALDLHSTILDRIVIKSKNTEIVYFLFSKELKQYSIRHSNILKGIRNTMRISLENMLSSFSIKEMSEQLQLEKTYLESVVKEAYNFEHMIGESDAIRAVFNQITEVASVDVTTLLLGETGTGKELIARAIHENSNRKERVLVKVNCAAIPSQIVESELFGHKKGAFTGAIQDRIGKFELANNGTIFLDEIGEMPLELQTKLLRVIQEREVERLGSNEVIKLNIRIIAATNKDLLEEIENGKFRADLYYRLNSFPIMVPPLKARDGDVLLLSDYFARQFSERYGLPFKGFTSNSLSRLKRYDWPGNVRELQNLMEQAIISQRGKVLEVYPGASGVSNLSWNDSSSNTSSSLVIPEEFNMDTIKHEKDKLERAFILQALEKTNWRVSGKNGAARLLDVASTTLESKMKKLGIKRNTI